MRLNLKPCTNHNFLITRPEHQAESLCRQIENLGGRGIILSTLTIQSRSFAHIAQAIARFPYVDKVIFTSANAVYPVVPHWKKITSNPAVFAVGPGTLKALTDFQITAKMPAMAQFNSEGLLDLPELHAVQNQCIIIFSGIGGRTMLTNQLVKRGACVEKIAVYSRECPMLTEIFPPSENISLVLSTSSESLKNLWQMVGIEGQAWLSTQQLLVISYAMQVLALQLGFKHTPLIASDASDAAILAAILAWCNKYPASEKPPTNQIV